MTYSRRSFLSVLTLIALALTLGQAPATVAVAMPQAAEEPAFPVSRLSVATQRGRFQFMVEVAETPSTWQQGLQRRQHLALDAGMLFDFQQPRPIWMKDTLISLDMIFIDGHGVVVNVAENTVPLSLVAISANVPVLAVLEVNAGTAARLGIRPGDRVDHPIFAASAVAPAK